MDLATVFEEYKEIITVASGLLGIVLGYFFGKWDSERRRKWEIEDRDYKRQADIHDMRIKEVRGLVDTYVNITDVSTLLRNR